MLRIAPVVLSSVVLVHALPVGTLAPTTQPSVATKPEPPPALPDIVITDVTVDAQCQVVARFANRGGPIPPDVKALSLEMTGLAKVRLEIPADSLRAPGATHAYTASGSAHATATPASQSVSLLARNPIMAEPNKQNNYATRNVACTVVPPGPDIQLTVTTQPDCTKTIELANVGDAPPDPSFWRGLPLRRRVDGFSLTSIWLGNIDPKQALAVPGGKVTWTEPADARAYDSFEYEAVYGPYEKGDSKANNVAKATVPAACKAPRPPVDVAVIEVNVDRNCRLFARVQNAGANALPPFEDSIRFEANGKQLATFGFSATTFTAPGATTTVIGPVLRETTPTLVTARFSNAALPQTRTDNDSASASLKCALAPRMPSMSPGTPAGVAP